MNPRHLVWSLFIDGKRTKKLEEPMALVGAAPLCDVVLTSPNAPWIAGLLVRTPSAVEFVPTHRNAEHLASSLLPGGYLDCLGVRLQVDFLPQRDESRVWPIIEILSPTRYAKVLLNQAVATLGSDFPSAIRVPSKLLEACKVILIPQHDRLLIYALPGSGNTQLKQLELDVGAYLKFKDIKIRLLRLCPSAAPETQVSSTLETVWRDAEAQPIPHAESKPVPEPLPIRVPITVAEPKTEPVPEMGVGSSPELLSFARIESPPHLGDQAGSEDEGELVRAQRSDQLAVKIRDIFQGRESKRVQVRVKVWIATSLALTVTALYFAWRLFGNLRPFL
jgi:hypothetical protein